MCSSQSTPSRMAMGLNTPDAWDGPCACQSVAAQVVTIGGILQQLQVQHVLLQQSVDQTVTAQQQQQQQFSMVQQQQQQELHWMQHAIVKHMLSTGGGLHSSSASVAQFSLDNNTFSINHKPPLETTVAAKVASSVEAAATVTEPPTGGKATAAAAATGPCTQYQQDKVEDSDAFCPSSNSSSNGFRCSTGATISKQSSSSGCCSSRSSSNRGSSSAVNNSTKNFHEVRPATVAAETRSTAASQSCKAEAKQAAPVGMTDAAAVAAIAASTVTAVPIEQATSATFHRAVTVKVAALAANSAARDPVKHDSESDEESEDDLEMQELGWHPYYRKFIRGSSGRRTFHQRSSQTKADEDLLLLSGEEDSEDTNRHAVEEVSVAAASQQTRCCATANSWAHYQAPTQSSRWPTSRRWRCTDSNSCST